MLGWLWGWLNRVLFWCYVLFVLLAIFGLTTGGDVKNLPKILEPEGKKLNLSLLISIGKSSCEELMYIRTCLLHCSLLAHWFFGIMRCYLKGSKYCFKVFFQLDMDYSALEHNLLITHYVKLSNFTPISTVPRAFNTCFDIPAYRSLSTIVSIYLKKL